jgi:hypothetical protein
MKHYCVMGRYFFHIFNGSTTIDEEGNDLPDIDAARAFAIRIAREFACESIREGVLNLDHRIEVTQEDNVRVLTMTFREAFQIIG